MKLIKYLKVKKCSKNIWLRSEAVKKNSKNDMKKRKMFGELWNKGRIKMKE